MRSNYSFWSHFQYRILEVNTFLITEKKILVKMKNNEVSSETSIKDESKKSEKASGGAKGPGLLKRLSSAMLLPNKECSAEPKKDNKKNEASETNKDEPKKSEKTKPKPGCFRRNSSVMFICYTLSFKNGTKITTDKK